MAVNKGRDFHDDNPFEEDAEKWAKKELSKWMKKYKQFTVFLLYIYK